MKETERKFLIEEVPPETKEFRETKVEQGYLAVTEDRGVRVRKAVHSESGKTAYTLTTKVGKGESRQEHETELAEGQFQELWPATKGQRVRKTRCEIDWNPWTIELDIYVRPQGLLTAEVELDGITEDFEPPEWFGPEITYTEPYKNKWLAKNGLPNQKPE